MIYRVRDWSRLYETSETRKRKFLSWVLVPNSHDSLGFCQLMARADGLEVFAVWCLVLQLASRCTARGTLASTSGKAYSTTDIATMVRAPEAKVEPALAVLVEVGWLESATSSGNDPDTSGDDPDTPANDPDTSGNNPDTSGNDSATYGMKKEREERKKERTPLTPQQLSEGRGFVIPKELNDPEFIKAWNAWCEYLEERGSALTPQRAQAQLDDMAGHGPALAVERLKTALMRNWQAPANLEGQSLKPEADLEFERLIQNVKKAAKK